jgi:hypothetical protein
MKKNKYFFLVDIIYFYNGKVKKIVQTANTFDFFC